MVLPLDRNHSWGRLECFILECFSIRVTGVWMSVVCIDKSGGAAKLESYLGISLLDIIFASILLCPWTFRCVNNVFCCGFSCLWYITLYLVGSCRGWAALGQCSCFPGCEVASQSSTYKRGCSCLKGMLRILEWGVSLQSDLYHSVSYLLTKSVVFLLCTPWQCPWHRALASPALLSVTDSFLQHE